MAAPTVYRSSDASAPVLTGAAGSLVAVLDACLVNGYGSQPAAGWTKAFAATNRGAYRMGGGNQFYLDVDDRGASSVLNTPIGNEAAVRGYETMSALSTGTGVFPTTAQIAANVGNWRKSSVADGNARSWLLIADDRSFFLSVRTGDTTFVTSTYGFGDIYSNKPSDQYRTFIQIRSGQNFAGTLQILWGNASTSFTAVANTYVARLQSGNGTASQGGYLSAALDTTALYGTQGDVGAIYMERIPISSSAGLRGWFRGAWFGHYIANLMDGDIVNGTNDLAGRQFIVMNGAGSAQASCILYEITTWDTST